jgi:hypothetical protein
MVGCIKLCPFYFFAQLPWFELGEGSEHVAPQPVGLKLGLAT